MPPSPSWKVVYAIVEKRQSPGRHWLRIGLAFVNADGSLNVRLDAIPLSGQLHIRDPNRAEGGETFADPPDTSTPPMSPGLAASTSRKRRP